MYAGRKKNVQTVLIEYLPLKEFQEYYVIISKHAEINFMA